LEIPSEEGHPQLFLEFLDALANCRLGPADALGGPGKRAFLHDGQEVLELQESHSGASCRDALSHGRARVPR
jgi:hypothetical protein